MMAYYVLIAIAVGVIIPLLMLLLTRKKEGVVYTTLDKVGMAINCLMSLIYVVSVPLQWLIGSLAEPYSDAGIIGYIIAIIIASAPIYCGLGIGLSIVYRRQGNSILSFAIQFLGVLGIIVMMGLYAAFAGTLLMTLN